MRKILSAIILSFISIVAFAQFRAPSEGWIAVPGSSADGYGVYHFKRNVNLTNINGNMRVWVSGDNRYKLYVNGKIVSIGPARSDLKHWNCEEVDLAPYLHTGDNTLSAVVWNDGNLLRPSANMTYRTGFLIHAIDKAASVLNTNSQWQCIQDPGYSPINPRVPGYYTAGPDEKVDMHKSISPTDPEGQGAAWKKAQIISGINYVDQGGGFGTYLGWLIKKSDLPQRELTLQRLSDVREAQGVKVGKGFLQGTAPLTIPANSSVKLLLDNRTLTNAYFTLNFKGGDNSKITLGYAETLYDKPFPANPYQPGYALTKGNRNEVKGKYFIGRIDTIISNGKDNQQFTTLSWRTYRYVQLTVTTGNESLTINDIYGTFTGYPFQLKASLDTKDAQLQQIFNVGWRTARLCAVETYMDCPYYEQLQYFGDSRIQALITLYMTGDDHMVKQLINMADWSREADGVTQSRYPSGLAQWIQPYALHYIMTLHDYMMYGNDTTFLKSKLMGERTILEYFHRFQSADGRLKDLPGWNFSDWVDNNPNWRSGVAVPGTDGYNAVLDLQLLYAYEMAADLEAHYGMKSYVDLYNQRIAQLKNTILAKYWRDGKGLFTDRSASRTGGGEGANDETFSQHANALAILADVVTGDKAKSVAEKIESDSTLAPASIYFKYYTHQAMAKAGLGNDYLSWLGIWKQYLQLGLTTWGETSDLLGTRSECHAWGASPNIELFRTVLGIDSDAPGFKHIRIEPHLGNINKIGGTMPTPNGNVTVQYQAKAKTLNATITLPASVTGTLSWQGKDYELHGGDNAINIK